MEGACFPALVVKTISGEGFLMIWGSSVFVITHWDPCKPVDYKYSRSTVCFVSPLCDICACDIICVIVSITVTPAVCQSPILIPVL